MSKLTKLLAEKEALFAEVTGLGAFLDRVEGKGTLVMTAVTDLENPEEGTDGIIFTNDDYELELEVLAPLQAHYATKCEALHAVEVKLAALEVLMS